MIFLFLEYIYSIGRIKSGFRLYVIFMMIIVIIYLFMAGPMLKL